MENLTKNLKHLRTIKGLSQQKIADALAMGRNQYAKYEQGLTSPTVEAIVRISNFYHITIDLLLKADLSRSSYEDILKMGENRLLLPVIGDDETDQAIEIVPDKAKAGYTTGYADPSYIEGLQTMKLPFLGAEKYRAFHIEGDSMLPLSAGSYVIGKYLESPNDVREGRTYIVVTLNDGLVYKRVSRIASDTFLLISDNPDYKPYQIAAHEILELWEYTCSVILDEPNEQSLGLNTIMLKLEAIHRDIVGSHAVAK